MNKPASSSTPWIFGAALLTLSSWACAHDAAGAANATPGRDTASASGGAFTLTRESDTEVLSYPQPRDLRICNRTGRDTATPVVPSDESKELQPTPLTERPVPTHATGPVALQLSYSGQTKDVRPGECLRFTSADVRITPASPLTAGTTLNGTIEQMTPDGTRNASTRGADLSGDRGDLAQMRAELARDDQTMRAATAELNRARDQLNEATRKLRGSGTVAEHQSGATQKPIREAAGEGDAAR